MDDDVAYVYVGRGAFLMGIPTRNLTTAEALVHRELLEAHAAASPQPIYVAVKKGQTVEDALAQPWPGYDEMTVDEIVPRLEGASDELRAKVAKYEKAHRDRKGVLEAIDDMEGSEG